MSGLGDDLDISYEDGADVKTAVVCPMCGCSRARTPRGPTYKPRRWFRRRPFWRCTWCKYEWEADE